MAVAWRRWCGEPAPRAHTAPHPAPLIHASSLRTTLEGTPAVLLPWRWQVSTKWTGVSGLAMAGLHMLVVLLRELAMGCWLLFGGSAGAFLIVFGALEMLIECRTINSTTLINQTLLLSIYYI